MKKVLTIAAITIAIIAIGAGITYLGILFIQWATPSGLILMWLALIVLAIVVNESAMIYDRYFK